MDKDLELLHQKIDFLTEQVMETKRRQREMEELRHDLMPIATDALNTAVQELDQISAHFSYEDVLFLIKRLLRNVRTITHMFEQVESATDFIKDMSPLTKDMFDSTLHMFNDMEQKGYFSFLKSVFDVLDKVVTNYSEEDVRQLGENIVLILNTVKQLTQPEIMQSVQNAVAIYRDLDVQPPESISLFGLLKTMNKPEIRKSIATGLALLENVSKNLENQQQTEPIVEH